MTASTMNPSNSGSTTPAGPPAMVRHTPLGAVAEQFGQLPAQLRVSEEAFRTQLNLRTDASGAGADAVARVLGVGLPAVPCSAVAVPVAGIDAELATDADVQVLWLGPDEWLIVAPADALAPLEGALRAVLPAAHTALVDVSAQRTTLRLRGELVAELLSKGCSVDLDPRVNGLGSCVQTMLAQAAVIIVPGDEQATDFRVLVRSSFARYLAAWIMDAALEYRNAATAETHP